MFRALRLVATPILALAAALALPGCQFGARRQLDECRRLSQALRSQNDQIKSQMLTYRNLSQDASERAVDDARRLAQQDEAIERLERSVQAYQSERDELQTAFRELRDSLPAAIRSAASPSGVPVRASRESDAAVRPMEFKIPIQARAEGEKDDEPERRTGWAPAAVEPASDPDPMRSAP